MVEIDARCPDCKWFERVEPMGDGAQGICAKYAAAIIDDEKYKLWCDAIIESVLRGEFDEAAPCVHFAKRIEG